MRVLISGAGIASPTLAYFLAKQGARITIVEKATSFRGQGQNIDIQGASITVIKKMGLLDEVLRWNSTEKGTQAVNSKGRPYAVFPVGENRVSATNPYEILRGDLALVLYGATKDNPNVNYMFDTTISEVVSNDEKAVKVKFNNGDQQEFDVLVAADGQWSSVRKQCFPPESIKLVDLHMYVVHWTMPRLPRDNNMWNIYFGLGSRNLSLRPDPHGTIRAMFTFMPCNEAQEKAWHDVSRAGREAQQKVIRNEFFDVGWETERMLDTMEQASDFYFHPLQQIKMSKWSNGRVICLGDAAYAPTPITGSGTPLAITGAYILAGELSKLKNDEHPSKAFEAYENVYRSHVENTQDVPSFVPGVAHPKTTFHRLLLQSFLWTLAKLASIPWLGKKMAPGDMEENNDGFPLPHYPTLDNLDVFTKEGKA